MFLNIGLNTIKRKYSFTCFRCLSKETSIVRSLPSKNLVRLTQNLIRVIEMAMDASESATQLAVDTIMPWILLYRLIYQLVVHMFVLFGQLKRDREPEEITDIILCGRFHTTA